MKRIALAAAIVVLAACSKAETPATDTTTPAMAPAPAAIDSVARADSIRLDSIRRADSAKGTKGKTP
jgi:hypothetical protein